LNDSLPGGSQASSNRPVTDSPITLRQVQQAATVRLATLQHASAELEAALLLCHLLGKPRSYLYAWPDHSLTPQQGQAYQRLVERRLQGEPIAYITGEREFWSLPLQVTPATLIPRPETELLVECALQHLQAFASPRIADLGTGSGAIALALASERPHAELHASDCSAAALAVATNNIQRLAPGRVKLFHGSWCDALPQGQVYDLIVSNPPYIEADDLHLMQGDLPHEPPGALISGPDGLDDIRAIAQQAMDRLKPGGCLLVEHGYQQGESVRAIFQRIGYLEVATQTDLAGHERVTAGYKQGDTSA
jgi:release factor glutamine methyltransferase